MNKLMQSILPIFLRDEIKLVNPKNKSILYDNEEAIIFRWESKPFRRKKYKLVIIGDGLKEMVFETEDVGVKISIKEFEFQRDYKWFVQSNYGGESEVFYFRVEERKLPSPTKPLYPVDGDQNVEIKLENV